MRPQFLGSANILSSKRFSCLCEVGSHCVVHWGGGGLRMGEGVALEVWFFLLIVWVGGRGAGRD